MIHNEKGQSMTLRELLLLGKKELRQAQVPDGDYDAWLLMEHVLKIEKSYYFIHGNDKIENEQAEKYLACIQKRKQRIPLQHITESAWFMGYEFYVNSNVLTPRFDTEILVEAVSKRLKPKMEILDVCTGSGCILLSLLAEHKDWNLKGVGVDISQEALKVARKNKERLAVSAEFLESDLFSKVEGTYDIIVSNPPYIATKELDGLMPEVREHEPRIALDGMEDGLHFYREILRQADSYLKDGGWICFEIGYDQGAALEAMLLTHGYKDVHIEKDLAGLDRVAIGRRE